MRLRYNCTAKKDPKEYLKLLALPVGNEKSGVQSDSDASSVTGSQLKSEALDSLDLSYEDMNY